MQPIQLERHYRNMAELFWDRVGKTPHLEAFRYPVGDTWRSLTWKQAGERVRKQACGLLSLGIAREERCAIWSSTRLEWILADTSILCAGAATTTIYSNTPIEDCVYILADSKTRLIFAENVEQVAALRVHRDKLPDLVKVVLFDGPPDKEKDGDWVIALADFEALGEEYAGQHTDALDELRKSIESDDLATLIYTSGTTGRPKGVRLVHDCWTYEAESQDSLDVVDVNDVNYLWLPLAHSFGKVVLAVQMAVGFSSAVDGRIPKLIDNLAVVRPTFMVAAPRIFEKAYNRIISLAKEGSPIKYKLFSWSISVGKEVSRRRRSGQEPSGLLALKHMVADKLVLSKIRDRFGGRIRFLFSGSAPLSPDIAEFFHATGMLILEGYGLTETSAATVVNVPNSFRFGTVGHPVPGTEIRIAEDGEILIKGPGVMRGYENLPDQTSAVFSEDGWFHSGDIGQIDEDGFLKITDRKKDLIKTSGGKYVAPQMLEGRFKAICPVVSQIVVHGDRRNYCTALITLDVEAITAWAVENDLTGASYEELTRSDKVRDMVQEYVDELNRGLASYETIKRFAILPSDLSEENGDLTPSLKVKRKSVETKYMDLLDSMYQGALESM
ncbi:MAG: long-chain fatty acid--CoA ligase [Proteobacteria bacterium]|nr:long-chain fatty acid--CoA ligase [Pseudomonadota bacterium]